MLKLLSLHTSDFIDFNKLIIFEERRRWRKTSDKWNRRGGESNNYKSNMKRRSKGIKSEKRRKRRKIGGKPEPQDCLAGHLPCMRKGFPRARWPWRQSSRMNGVRSSIDEPVRMKSKRARHVSLESYSRVRY